MGYESDFSPLQEWPFKSHEEVFEYVEALRQITGYGAELVTLDHAYLKQKYANYVAKRFHMYGPDDRGGVFGMFQKDPMGIATEIVRPIEAIGKNLQEAQAAAAKFKPVFYKWLDPVIHPRPARGGRGDDFDDRFPGGAGARPQDW